MMTGIPSAGSDARNARLSRAKSKGSVSRYCGPPRRAWRYALASSPGTVRSPGSTPARNIAPTDRFDTRATTTIMRLGGMIWASEPAHAMMAAAKSTSYFRRRSSGCMIEETAATSAEPEPEMAASPVAATTDTMRRLPTIQPTSAVARSTMRREIPPASMIAPANTKNGIAMIVNELRPSYMRWETMVSGMSGWVRMRVAAAARPSTNTTGMPTRSSTRKIENAKITRASSSGRSSRGRGP